MIYEYRCLSPKCGVMSEVVQRLSEEPLKKCPKCKRGKVMKLISLTANPVVKNDARDEIVKIKREAKEIARKINRGDENAIADVFGEDVANGKAAKPAPAPKTLDSIKNGKIKRRK